MRKKTWAALITAAALLLGGCGSPTESAEALKEQIGSAREQIGSAIQSDAQSTGKQGSYRAPPFHDAVFNADAAEGRGSTRIDLSSLQDGYVAVSCSSDKRLKFQVICGDETYTYNLSSDGTPSVYPLSCGSGSYRFRVMENIKDSKYAEIYSVTRSVSLSDEFQPFLRPSVYVPYGIESACVKKASELAGGVDTEVELVAAVYTYLCRSIRYDTKKAETVSSGYLPDPDETMRSGKGICFDYAALAAAMLRSQGIPTKEIFGYVSPNDVYHAWNMFYTAESGWVTVSFEVNPEDWTRMDVTFAANGADSRFIGDGGNYADLYWY